MGRKKYSKELNARIELDAIKGQKTIAELSTQNISFHITELKHNKWYD
jgi:hypothetical protein